MDRCGAHWISRPRAHPNCTCWQWLGLAARCVLSEAAERAGFHSTSCLSSLQWKSPVTWPMGLSRFRKCHRVRVGFTPSAWHCQNRLRRRLNLWFPDPVAPKTFIVPSGNRGKLLISFSPWASLHFFRFPSYSASPDIPSKAVMKVLVCWCS